MSFGPQPIGGSGSSSSGLPDASTLGDGSILVVKDGEWAQGVDKDPKGKSFAAQEGISGGSLTGGAVIASEDGDTAQLDAQGLVTINALEVDLKAIPEAASQAAPLALASDAPNTHAASHVSGADQIADATAEAHGLMTAADFSKLGGIEAGANVTDAENVAAAGAVMTSSLVVKLSVAALIYAAELTIDLSTSNNFSLTLTGDCELQSPSNVTIGQSGIVTFTQDGSGAHALTFAAASIWTAVGGVMPGINTDADAVSCMAYYAISATKILVNVLPDV